MRRSIADIWSRSERILSSGDIGRGPVPGAAEGYSVAGFTAGRARAAARAGSGGARGQWFEPADFADAQARGVGHGNFGLVEDHPAVDRVERAQRRPVQIDL